ncbi:glycosyltransferase [Celeribacter sp. PS-C1]|uniref:glycosyltransferase family 8 protein n=1 Tax=Celeribacter sp. PS-C1 TaxID=2820813 RepID=UPI001CA51DF9|nr:glycosyltransferase [Celeribacter sp. PS-C1]MBW6417478.1 hypothetical protein [Celeribacter sp. PS-C1]
MSAPAHFSYVFNRGYAFPSLVSLSSLLRQSRKGCEVLLLTDCATPRFKAALDCLRERHPEARINLVEDPTLPGAEHPLAHKVRLQNFWQLSLYKILPRKSLAIDGDTLVIEDPAEAYETPLGQHAIAAAPDYHFQDLYYRKRYYRRFYPFEQDKWRDIPAILLKSKRDIPLRHYCNNGIVLIDMPRLRATGWADRLCDLDTCLSTKLEKGWEHNDQDWMNFMFAGRIAPMPLRWNFQIMLIVPSRTRKRYTPRHMRKDYKDGFARPGILHFAGDRKPWRDMETDTDLSTLHREAFLHWRKEAERLSEETGMDIRHLCNDPSAA